MKPSDLVHDALMVTKDVLEKPQIVAGGGSTEGYIANELREWSSSIEGRAQLAVRRFADALDSIPLTLAENAGMDPIDTMAELRSKQSKGPKWNIGVDVRNLVVTDMFKQNVLEPLVVKEQIIKSATEAACMILRVDDVITAKQIWNTFASSSWWWLWWCWWWNGHGVIKLLHLAVFHSPFLVIFRQHNI